MAYGLEVWNAAGTKIVSISDRLTRFHGTFEFTVLTSTTTFFVTIPGYALDGTWFFVCPNALDQDITLVQAAGGLNGNNTRSRSGTFKAYVFRG